MPVQRSTTKGSRGTTPPSNGPATRGQRPNGNGGNGKPNAWPVELVLSAEVELSIETENSTAFGFAVCSLCAAILPGSDISRKLHQNFHEQVRGLEDSRGR
jgi:hypothetical protein